MPVPCNVTFEGGEVDGAVVKHYAPLPRCLVFQRQVDGRFVVDDYVRVGNSAIYRFLATRPANCGGQPSL